MTASHIPVLLDEVLTALMPRSVARVIDGTLGAGGHTAALLQHGVEAVLGLDVDPQALRIAQARLQPFGERAHVYHASYEALTTAAADIGWDAVDGILLDLGVSSMQVDTPERGFAFLHESALDMRFDPTGTRPTAAEIVNYWEQGELADIIFNYGEEKFSRRIARAIIAARPVTTTTQLAEIVKEAVPKAKQNKGIHPATLTFQALRIAVNDELGRIERVLPQAIDLLRPGGRLAVISFHSLEDRIVKRMFKTASTEIKSPPGMVLEEKVAQVKLITRKPIVATDEEIARNRRSRSAKLRVVEKL